MSDTLDRTEDFCRRHKKALGLIVLCLLYLAHIGNYHLMDNDEGRYVRVAMEMALSGDFVTPTLDHMPFFDKPALPYWVNALLMQVFGVHEWTGRFFPAVTGIGDVLLAYLLGRRMFGERAGRVGALVLATTALHLIVASIAITDMPVTFFINAALASFYLFKETGRDRWRLVFYAALGLGALCKGLIALVFPVGIIAVYLAITRQLRLLRFFLYLPGLLLFFVIAAPWYYAVMAANPDFFDYFFVREQFLRFLTKVHKRFHPWYFLLLFVIVGTIPWTGFFSLLAKKDGILRQMGAWREHVTYLLVWFLFIYLFYTFSSSKLATYILPCWLPMSLLLGAAIEREREAGRSLARAFHINVVFCLILLAAIVVFFGPMEKLSLGTALFYTLPLVIVLVTMLAFSVLYTPARRRGIDMMAYFATLACLFGFALHPVQGYLHDTQSAYETGQIINTMPKDARIVSFDAYTPGIMYYTDRLITTGDNQEEFAFGLTHTDRPDAYMSHDEILADWKAGKPMILVTNDKAIKEGCLKLLEGTEYHKIYARPYTILTNIKGEEK